MVGTGGEAGEDPAWNLEECVKRHRSLSQNFIYFCFSHSILLYVILVSGYSVSGRISLLFVSAAVFIVAGRVKCFLDTFSHAGVKQLSRMKQSFL